MARKNVNVYLGNSGGRDYKRGSVPTEASLILAKNNAYQTVLDTSTTSFGGLMTCLQIRWSGTAANGGLGITEIKITVDGTAYTYTRDIITSGNTTGGQEEVVIDHPIRNIPFDVSLKVEVKDNNTGTTIILPEIVVGYLLYTTA